MKSKWKLLGAACAAALLTIGASSTALAAGGWAQEDGTWVYLDGSGYRMTDVMKKSGDNWYYLDSDGYMATNILVSYNDNYYYFNSAGAMLTNNWRQLPNEEYSGEENEPEDYWYYFTSTGKAYKSTSDRVSFKSITLASGETKKFTFDSEGRMLTGWVSESGERLTDDQAWMSALYYCGPQDGDGGMATGWQRLNVTDDREADSDQNYWFYFGTNGKMVKDQTKTINGRKYTFDEYGAAVFEWYQLTPPIASPTHGYTYYNNADRAWRAEGWFYTVPDEAVDAQAYADDQAYWFYANKDGSLLANQLKTINGQKYAFNEKGEMLYGLYKLELEDGNRIKDGSIVKIETLSDLPDYDDDVKVYYFGDSPKEGAMATGSKTVEVDGERYTYYFGTGGSSKGIGENGIYKNAIYIHGRKLKAESDMRYDVVELDGRDYLVNVSGTIMKNKTNIKDSDEYYYCTDSQGVVTYKGTEKYTRK